MSAFWHVRPVLDAPLGALGEDLAWPDAPVMWRAPPDTRVFLVDHGFKRHVPSAAVAASWGLDLSKVVTKSPAQVDALALGPPLPANRVVVKGTGSAVYVLDVALPRPAVDAGTPTPDAGVEPFDAGVEPLDGGDEVDGGPSEPGDVDGGENVADDEPDAGDGSPTLPDDTEPHGCAAAPGSALLMLALAWVSRRRTRRR
ncbi:MAG: hypothetical protein IPJ65_20935 [Archangiaceae bacterium]|nr:hypothetical protein [Archangiaceae bacterium]